MSFGPSRGFTIGNPLKSHGNPMKTSKKPEKNPWDFQEIPSF
jgi:hypothetical protein